MGRMTRNRLQFGVFALIASVVAVGLFWVIAGPFEDSEDSAETPVPAGLDQQVSEAIRISALTDVVARVGAIEVTRNVIEAAFLNRAGQQALGRNQVIKQAVDAEIVNGLKLRVAELEGLVGDADEARRQMELNRASCEAEPGCKSFVDGLVSREMAESRDAYWEAQMGRYRDGLSLAAANRFLAGDRDDSSQVTIDQWFNDLRVAEQQLLEGIEIEWFDADLQASYEAAR